MATSPRRVCWDACTWIALIQSEKVVENGVERGTRCRAVIEEAKKGKIEIAISALCLAEVCKNRDVKDDDPQKIAAFFEQDYIIVVSLDRMIGERARALMMSGLAGLKPQDACHLATAAMTPNLAELHTFDTRLLGLNGQIARDDGTPLKICRPDVGTPPSPLFAGQGGGI